LLGEKDVKYTG